jgi:WD40 repeat protein
MGGSTLYWSNDGKRLLSVGDSIVLWDVESGKEVAKLIEKNTDPYTKVAWTADSKYLAIVDENHIVQLYDSEKGRKIKQLATNFNVDPFDADNDSVLIGGRGIFLTRTAEALQIWDAESGSSRKILAENRKIIDVVLSADSEKVIALDGDKIRLWNTRDGSAMPALDGQFSRFHTLGTGDSLRLITVGLSGEAKLWNGKTGAHMKDLPVVLPRSDFDVEPEFLELGRSKRFALGTAELVELWDSTTGERLQTLPVKAQSLRWSDDENLVLLQNNPLIPDNQNEPAQIWDAQTGKLLTTLPIMDGFNGLFQVSWAGRRLITNQLKDGSLQVWELRFTPPTISEMIENVRNHSGYKIENEELVESRKEASPRP